MEAWNLIHSRISGKVVTGRQNDARSIKRQRSVEIPNQDAEHAAEHWRAKIGRCGSSAQIAEHRSSIIHMVSNVSTWKSQRKAECAPNRAHSRAACLPQQANDDADDPTDHRRAEIGRSDAVAQVRKAALGIRLHGQNMNRANIGAIALYRRGTIPVQFITRG
jgi:hypothetical protein